VGQKAVSNALARGQQAERTSPEVELKLLAFQNVTVTSSTLAWARRDSSVKATSLELGFKKRVDFAFSLQGVELFLLAS